MFVLALSLRPGRRLGHRVKHALQVRLGDRCSPRDDLQPITRLINRALARPVNAISARIYLVL